MITLKEAKNIEDAKVYLRQDIGFEGDSDGIKFYKDHAFEELSDRTGLGRGDINQILSSWADSSNDHDPISLHMQKLAQDELGAHLSKWQEKNISEFDFTAGDTKERGNFIKSMYDWTQEDLEEFGLKELTLYRGMGNRQGLKPGDEVDLECNAVDSWTADPEIADSFARGVRERGGIVVKCTFPANRILSSARTGLGCLNESEFTVLNSGPTHAVITKKVDEL
jgi:hypothetical protein